MNQALDLLKESLDALRPVHSEAIGRFFDRLMNCDLHASKSFRLHLLNALEFVHLNLEDNHKFRNYFYQLGSRHAEVVVEASHQNLMADWLKTLSFFFGDTWTQELSDSWLNLLQEISAQLIKGAESSFQSIENTNVHQIHKTESTMKDEVQGILREMIRETIHEMIREDEVRQWIREDVKSLLKEMMFDEISQLREKWKTKQAA